jgi:hypothetical protein
LRQDDGFLRLPPPIKLIPTIKWNIVKSVVKHHNTTTTIHTYCFKFKK